MLGIYVSNIKITDKEYYEAHHVGQDDFALQVSGKDHQYLNTGVSLIYENSAHEGTNEQHVVILSGLDSENAEFDNDQDTDRHAYFEGSIDENFKKTSGHKEDSSLHPHVWEWVFLNRTERLENKGVSLYKLPYVPEKIF